MDYFNGLQNAYPFLKSEVLGNSLYGWAAALLIFLVALAVLKLIQVVVIARLKKLFAKTKTGIDDMIIGAIAGIYWPFYVFAAVYFALQFLSVPDILRRIFFYLFMGVLVYYAIKFLSQFIDFGAAFLVEKRNHGENAGIIKLLGTVAKIVLWIGAGVMILANMGYNVTSLVTGLGIGGIAVALAVQNILGDLFNSLAIYFDKPFKNGDFIVIGDYMGTVKKVGIKTTRIQALQGEEIVVSNSDLMGARIQNFGVMEKRRIVFTVGVAYDTPAEKLKEIPAVIKKIITDQPNADVDRAHFQSFGDSSLVYEVVYYVQTGDYNTYMDIQQAINLAIVNKFAAEGIEIAFPTRTVYLKKD